MDEGQEKAGIYQKRLTKVGNEGEEFEVAIFEDPKTNEPFSLRLSAGLRMALDDADIKEGDRILIKREADFENKKGNRQSHYEIYSL